MNNIQKFNDRITKNRKTLNLYIDSISHAWELHAEFLKKFPFRDYPEAIDLLSPESLFNPGQPDYFFLYLEHKLKPFSHLAVGSTRPWRSAVGNIGKFKQLLKIAVNPNMRLAEKIDAPWEAIKGWGGDKHCAKKLLFCYFPDQMIPILNTNHMVHFVVSLGMSDELELATIERYGNPLEKTTLGQKYEALTDLLLLAKKQSIFKLENIAVFSQALYLTFLPKMKNA